MLLINTTKHVCTINSLTTKVKNIPVQADIDFISKTVVNIAKYCIQILPLPVKPA